MKTNHVSLPVLTLSLGLSVVSGHAAPLGSAFTYQGRLTDGGGAPATGFYDLRFTITAYRPVLRPEEEK